MGASTRRSFADPISSLIFLGKLDLQRWINDLSMQRRFPVHALPQFLHESTHHWCFNSPVGIAFQLLSFRAAQQQISTIAEGYNSHESAISLFKLKFWQHLMLPLFEGLALFAEHDAAIGDAPTISEPFTSLVSLVPGTFNDGLVNVEDLFVHASDLLSLARNSTEHYDRKTSLLLEPFSTKASPYLCGYLTVKCLYFECVRRNSMFADTDFFLLFLKSYLFDDWEVVRLLLSQDGHDPEEVADQLYNHLVSRVMDFFDSTGQASVDKFIKRSINEAGDRELFVYSMGHEEIRIYSDPIGTPPSDEATGALQAGLDELFKATDDESNLLEVVRSIHIYTLNTRRLLLLGQATFASSINSSGRIFIWSESGQLVASFTSSIKTFPEGWKGELTVVLVLMPKTKKLHQIYLDGDTVISIFPEVSDVREFETLMHPMVAPNIRSHNLRVLERITESPSKMAELWLDEILESRARQIDTFYSYAAFLFVDEATVLADILKYDGFLSLLDGEVELVEHLGCLSSVAASKCLPLQGSEAEKRLAAAINSAKTINEKLKFHFNFEPLFLEGDRLLFSLL